MGHLGTELERGKNNSTKSIDWGSKGAHFGGGEKCHLQIGQPHLSKTENAANIQIVFIHSRHRKGRV